MTRLLVVLDVDSTLIENEVIELLAEEAGSVGLVAEITDRAMRGELDFAQSLRQRVATLAGLDAGAIDRARTKIRVTTGVPDLLASVHARDGWVGAVSGGFHEILDPLAESLGLDRWRANRLEVGDDGRLTGFVDGPIVDAAAKATALREWAEEGGFAAAATVAIGDGANDLQMMAAAGTSIAFCAKPIVAEAADVAVSERDMRLVLPLIGL